MDETRGGLVRTAPLQCSAGERERYTSVALPTAVVHAMVPFPTAPKFDTQAETLHTLEDTLSLQALVSTDGGSPDTFCGSAALHRSIQPKSGFPGTYRVLPVVLSHAI